MVVRLADAQRTLKGMTGSRTLLPPGDAPAAPCVPRPGGPAPASGDDGRRVEPRRLSSRKLPSTTPPRDTRDPWPERGAKDEFVGRQHEVGALDELRRVREGQPRVVLVHGPAGIGKTALVQRFLLGRGDLRVLWGTSGAALLPRHGVGLLGGRVREGGREAHPAARRPAHLRHAVMHLEHNVPVAIISAWLGHSDTAFTIRTYVDNQPENSPWRPRASRRGRRGNKPTVGPLTSRFRLSPVRESKAVGTCFRAHNGRRSDFPARRDGKKLS